MTPTARINVTDGDILAALRQFFKQILQLDDISAILLPVHLAKENRIMPALVTQAAALDNADPLAPCFPLNAAKLVSRLSHHPMGQKVAVVLRPCEIRAFIELVKLKQGNPQELLIIGLDCLGAFTNTDYRKLAANDAAALTRRFWEKMLSDPQDALDDVNLAPACRMCENPVPGGADVLVGLWGVATRHELLAAGQTDAGAQCLQQLALDPGEVPPERDTVIAEQVARRTTARDAVFAATAEKTDSLDKLTGYLADCINCLNCRVACPVCYCRECVFTTDVFDHEPFQYLKWAQRKGVVKMPTDTVFYHLTRLTHMSTACIGCGQCSNACPNDVGVVELFRMVAHDTQKAFAYEAGRSLADEPPLAVFRENEFPEATGLRK